jgi:hypothetical protein
MKKGDYVYYYRKGIGFTDCIPAIVLDVKKRVKIAFTFEKDESIWVNPNKLELQ